MPPLLAIAAAAGLAAAPNRPPIPPAQLFQRVRGGVYEVVLPKPPDTGASYAERLPLEKLPYQERTDSVWSIGSAFAVGRDTVLTAAHVMNLGVDDPSQEPMLRDARGRVLRLGTMLKYSNHEDYALFTVPGLDCRTPLRGAKGAREGDAVHAVGNALGEGIVLRDGLITSRTPEQTDGAWKYWRFSAAASPGNSGGPLLDAQGALVGIVQMKSESENLNYALPWEVVQAAPTGRGRYFESSSYSHPQFPDAEISTRLDTAFALPPTWRELDRAVWTISDRKTRRDRDSVLRAQRGAMFPRGRSGRLRIAPLFSHVPASIYRGGDGWWAMESQRIGSPVDLGANGTWVQNDDDRVLSGCAKLPDTVGLQEFVRDSRRLGDLILKGGRLARDVAGKEIRVVSLGRAVIDSQRTDPWGRVWLVRGWRQPWDGSVMLAQILPVPNGFGVLLGVYSDAASRSWMGLRLQDVADGSLFPWSGSFERWKAWLAMPDIVPTFLRGVRMDSDGAPAFSWKGGTLRLSPALGPVPTSPEVLVTPAFLDVDHDSVAMGVGSVALSPSTDGSALAMLVRMAPPASDLGAEARSDWRKRVEQRAPFDGRIVDGGDGKRQACRLIPASLKRANSDPTLSAPVWMSILLLDEAPSQKRVDRIMAETLEHAKVPEEPLPPR